VGVLVSMFRGVFASRGVLPHGVGIRFVLAAARVPRILLAHGEGWNVSLVHVQHPHTSGSFPHMFLA